jgi:hypothetical protein
MGTREQQLAVFRAVRDQVAERIRAFVVQAGFAWDLYPTVKSNLLE